MSETNLKAVPILMPVKATLPINIEGTIAMTQLGSSLVFVNENEEISIIPISIDQKSFQSNGNIVTKIIRHGQKVKSVKDFHGHILLHIKNRSTGVKTLLFIPPNFQPFPIKGNVDCFAPNMRSNRTMAVMDKSKFYVITFDNEISNNYRTSHFLDLSGQGISIGFSFNQVIVLTTEFIYSFDIENLTVINKLSQNPSKNAIILFKPQTSWFYYNDIQCVEIKSDLSPPQNCKPLTFSTPAIGHTRSKTYFISITNIGYVAYNFVQQPSDLYFEGCKKIITFDIDTSKNEKSALIITNTNLYILREIQTAFDSFISEKYSEIINYLPNNDLETRISFFTFIWNFKNNVSLLSEKEGSSFLYRIKSFNLLLLNEFQEFLLDILLILGNFSFVIEEIGSNKLNEELDIYDSPNKLTNIPINRDPNLLSNFLQFLQKNINSFSRQNIKYINSALSQYYLLNVSIKEIVQFLSKKPELSENSMYCFFENNPNLELSSLFLLYFNFNLEYITSFISIPNKTQEIFDIFFNILINYYYEFDFIQSACLILFKSYPFQTISFLNSDLIDFLKFSPFVQKNFGSFHLRYLYNSINRKDLTSHHIIVRDLASKFCNLLFKVESNSFELSDVNFLDCFEKNNNSEIDLIEKELSTKIIFIIKNFTDDVDFDELRTYSQKIKSDDVIFAINTLIGNVKEAIKIKWESSNKSFDAVTDFCKTCQYPKSAFNELIDLLKTEYSIIEDQKENNEFISKLLILLKKFIEFIDIEYVINSFPDEFLFNNVCDDLIFAYRNLIGYQNDSLIITSYIDSENFETSYNLVLEKSKKIDIDINTLCTGCKKNLGFTYIQRKPNGNLYHEKCLHLN